MFLFLTLLFIVSRVVGDVFSFFCFRTHVRLIERLAMERSTVPRTFGTMRFFHFSYTCVSQWGGSIHVTFDMLTRLFVFYCYVSIAFPFRDRGRSLFRWVGLCVSSLFVCCRVWWRFHCSVVCSYRFFSNEFLFIHGFGRKTVLIALIVGKLAAALGFQAKTITIRISFFLITFLFAVLPLHWFDSLFFFFSFFFYFISCRIKVFRSSDNRSIQLLPLVMDCWFFLLLANLDWISTIGCCHLNLGVAFFVDFQSHGVFVPSLLLSLWFDALHSLVCGGVDRSFPIISFRIDPSPSEHWKQNANGSSHEPER